MGVNSTVSTYYRRCFGCHSVTQNLNVGIIWWFPSAKLSSVFQVRDNTVRFGFQNDTRILFYERRRSLCWSFAVLSWRFHHNSILCTTGRFFRSVRWRAIPWVIVFASILIFSKRLRYGPKIKYPRQKKNWRRRQHH